MHGGRSATLWKAGYGGYGPRVPSIVGPIILVGVGIVALLMVTGHIDSGEFWSWYGHWWPLLLIGAGLALLGEWALDMKRQTPVRRGGSFVGILILLAIIGLFASWGHEWWGPMRAQWGDHGGDNFFNMFGRPQHDHGPTGAEHADSGQRAGGDSEPARRCQHHRRR